MIIPIPSELKNTKSSALINGNITICGPKAISNTLIKLKDFIERNSQIKTSIETEFSSDNQECISFIKTEIESGNDEAYQLSIASDVVKAYYQTQRGAYYAVQTLKQIIYQSERDESGICLPGLEIKDEPRFKWRGFMLDDCRHFHGKQTVKRMLDIMALLKMNVFHWHLTEDQGWRIEIEKYPKLTSIGSKRADTQLKHSRSKNFRGEAHSGYYTKDDVAEILDYAKQRFIRVIPEIEIPGHSQAAIASYPELGCSGEKVEVATTFGIKDIVYCPGKEHTFEFWHDVLDEVMDMFPSEIIHIGGDEVPKRRWKECPNCQAKIKTENLDDEEDLQVFVTNSIASYLASHGRRLMGWNEILDEGLESNAICHYWAHDEDEVISHIKDGRDTVVSKSQFTYLNSSYRRMPLEDVYKFDPMLKGLNEKDMEHILGIESPCWTEWIPDRNTLEFQVFPRLLAIAETSWSPKSKKNYTDFKNRLKRFEKILDQLNISYADEDARDTSMLGKIRRFVRKIF